MSGDDSWRTVFKQSKAMFGESANKMLGKFKKDGVDPQAILFAFQQVREFAQKNNQYPEHPVGFIKNSIKSYTEYGEPKFLVSRDPGADCL